MYSTHLYNGCAQSTGVSIIASYSQELVSFNELQRIDLIPSRLLTYIQDVRFAGLAAFEVTQRAVGHDDEFKIRHFFAIYDRGWSLQEKVQKTHK